MIIPVPAQAVVQPEPVARTLEQRAIGIAEEYGISTTTFTDLIYAESRWDAKADNGEDRGILQINRYSHPEVSDECAFDTDCAMRWSAQRIKDGYLYEWVPCNCYLYARTLVSGLPSSTKQITPNSRPVVGAVAILNFNGVIHYQVITGFDSTGYFYKGANRKPCNIQAGHDDWGDTRLVGFYLPPRSLAVETREKP